MNLDCVYFPTGCGQPVLKPRSARKFPTDHYYPSYCSYCHDYRPAVQASTTTVTPSQVVVKHHYINQPKSSQRQPSSKDSYKGIK